jgi:hypothetical protein
VALVVDLREVGELVDEGAQRGEVAQLLGMHRQVVAVIVVVRLHNRDLRHRQPHVACGDASARQRAGDGAVRESRDAATAAAVAHR